MKRDPLEYALNRMEADRDKPPPTHGYPSARKELLDEISALRKRVEEAEGERDRLREEAEKWQLWAQGRLHPELGQAIADRDRYAAQVERLVKVIEWICERIPDHLVQREYKPMLGPGIGGFEETSWNGRYFRDELRRRRDEAMRANE